jgi:hypothetical protein
MADRYLSYEEELDRALTDIRTVAGNIGLILDAGQRPEAPDVRNLVNRFREFDRRLSQRRGLPSDWGLWRVTD